MTKISPTARQVVRSYSTIQTRRTAMMTAWNAGHGWRRKAAGVRRAKAKTLRLMAEYFGVGEPVPSATYTDDRGVLQIRLGYSTADLAYYEACAYLGFKQELARDRGKVRITRAS